MFRLSRMSAWLIGVMIPGASVEALAQVPVPPPVGSALPAAQPADPPPVARDLPTYRHIVKAVIPAVVSIEARGRVAEPRRAALPPGVPEEYRRFFEDPRAAEANKGSVDLGFGSGVIIDATGTILTASHVVDGADSVEVHLQDGRKIVSKDIRRDAKTDLALIRLAGDKPFPFLELGDSDAMEVGDRVLAVGAPFGLTGSVTHGIVSAKSRNNLKLNQYEDFLQTDAPINPGNSGGPLINLDGKVIGINTAIKTKSGGFQGVGLAVSSNMAREVVKQLQKDGVVRRGYLGVALRELDQDLANHFGLPRDAGVIVSRVYADSPAARAGLQVGDVLTSLAGNPIKDLGALSKVMYKLEPGQQIEMVYLRNGKAMSIQVKVEAQPGDYGARAVTAKEGGDAQKALPVAALGLYVTDLTPDLAGQLGYPKGTRGAMIAGISKTGPAALAGLTQGMLIVRVDKTPIVTAEGLIDVLGKANAERGVLLQLLRPSGESEFVVLKVQ